MRFTAGTIVSAGEYRNTETGAVHYFDGNTPLPGGANAASWQQISDHFHSARGEVTAALAAPSPLRDGEVTLLPLDDGVPALLVAASHDDEVTRWTEVPAGMTHARRRAGGGGVGEQPRRRAPAGEPARTCRPPAW